MSHIKKHEVSNLLKIVSGWLRFGKHGPPAPVRFEQGLWGWVGLRKTERGRPSLTIDTS